MKIMQLKSHLLIVLLLSVTFLCSCQKESTPSGAKTKFAINFTPAKTSNELVDIKANSTANVINSLSNFDMVVNNYNSPLSKLTSSELANLRQGLVFRDKVGLVSIDYTVIQSKLGADDFAEVMTYFGLDIKNGYWGLSVNTQVNAEIRGSSFVSDVAAEDHNGYTCFAKNTCKVLANNICLSGC